MTFLVCKTDVSTVCHFYAILKQFDFVFVWRLKYLSAARPSIVHGAVTFSGHSPGFGVAAWSWVTGWGGKQRELFKCHGEGKGKSYCVFPISHESLQRTNDTATDVCRDLGLKALVWRHFYHTNHSFRLLQPPKMPLNVKKLCNVMLKLQFQCSSYIWL